jgi:hypothetical protein
MKETLLQKIIAHIFGRKYYANIINTRGTARCELTCFIFNTKEQAEQHRKENVDSGVSFMYIETISFRSRKEYVCKFPDVSLAK